MYRLQNYTTYEQIEKLKPQWEQIYNSNKELTPFQSFTWNKCLIENKIYKGNLNFTLLYKNEELLIIAPFVNKNKILYNEATFLGMNTHTDYLNFIYAQNLEYEDFEYFITKIFSYKKKQFYF